MWLFQVSGCTYINQIDNDSTSLVFHVECLSHLEYRMADSEADMQSDQDYTESPRSRSSTSLVSEVHDTVEKMDDKFANLLKTIKTKPISDVKAVIKNIEKGPETFQIELRHKYNMVRPVDLSFDENDVEDVESKATYSASKSRFV